jgi:hypothetical protein
MCGLPLDGKSGLPEGFPTASDWELYDFKNGSLSSPRKDLKRMMHGLDVWVMVLLTDRFLKEDKRSLEQVWLCRIENRVLHA